ncbi:MAG: hypothetical protein KF812_04035 [Fimbriimonadaceae bacterium]|nr:hypothetical protein [Fimbriimonadaceae bacterium]
MIWEATDQFGNMYVGVSGANSWDEAGRDIAALVEELAARSDEFVVSVDCEFGDMNGPHPDQVSHVLQMPWISEQANAFPRIEALVQDAALRLGASVSVTPVS